MENSSQEAPEPPDEMVANVRIATRFLTALFAETDTILFRPIETWVEAGRKRSRVDYRDTVYRRAVLGIVELAVLRLLQLAERDPLNLFFGACPRVGDKGRFDLAWQIRKVPALWTDIDNVTVDEARGRVAKAAVPEPSIVVNSGNGVHLYWLLDTPYLIDDAGDPPAVLTEWVETPGRPKKPRKYVLENGDHIYLDQRRHTSRLSPKAEHIQDILAGIAKAVGGDHTTDLSRLLRIPGTLNRKDERNGRDPVPTELVACDPVRKYPLSAFEPLKSASPETERAKKISAMPLPTVRKLCASKADRLGQLIAACEIAPAGSRSEADFGVCCYAIRSGIRKDEVWVRVENVGKFAEQGQRYFDVTWENAEFDVRAGTFDKLEKRGAGKASKPRDRTDGDIGARDGGGEPPTPDGDGDAADGRPTITVDPSITPVADTLHQVTDRLLTAGNCFIRSDQLVVVNDQQIFSVLSSKELAGLLNQHVEFYFIDDEEGAYKPFPANYANTWLNQHRERSRLPVIKLFTRNPVFTADWRLVTPGFDARSGIFYGGPPVEVSGGTEHLDALLQDFCFKAPGDRTNYIGVLLTALLVPRFIGSKPAALFNGNQAGLGKTILAQTIAVLRDGQTTETVSYNPNDEEFEKRLGAIVRRGSTTIIVDNAKSRGRNPRIESACLERSITDPVLSFRLLGQSASIRAENSHIFAITANTPDVSRDLVTRSVVINLHLDGSPERREFSIADPEGYAQQHRLQLLGELIGMVERWKAAGMPIAKVHSRFNKRGWGGVVGGILETCGEPDFLANAEEAAAQLDETRRDFQELVSVMADHPQGVWPAGELVDLCKKHSLLTTDLGEGSDRSLSSKLGIIAGRFVDEQFPLADERQATFHREDGRKGKLYRVSIIEHLPNVGAFAERLPNLENDQRSAHEPFED